MDPVTALGVAAAILQFLDAGIKVLKTCKEVRDDAQSATQSNRELEQATWTLEHYRSELGSVIRSPSTDRRVVVIAHDCARTAKELIGLLEYARGGSKQIGSARATWRAILKRKPIEQLEKTLRQREEVLDKVLNQDTNASVCNLRDDLRKQGISTRESIDQLSSRMTSASLATHRRVTVAERNIHRRLDNAERQTQRVHDESRKTQDQERFLSSLFFPDIDQRQRTIKEAHPGTLEWLFRDLYKSEASKPDVQDPTIEEAQTGMLDWLIGYSDDCEASVPDTQDNKSSHKSAVYDSPGRSFEGWLGADASMYWISGKAGSGKSVLMAHVVGDERTKSSLQHWTHGSPLHIISFFFWRPGSDLQKSVLGLLRSVLFQLCRLIPEAIPAILMQMQRPVSLLPTWTEKTLTTAVRTAITIAEKTHLCVFVDGLDEFAGDQDGLVDLLFDLQAFDNVKCCVASRPDAQLRAKLAECESLRMEDLNSQDISNFVSDKLRSLSQADAIREELVRAVVIGAEGVFMWAALVTQSIMRGDRLGDDPEVLMKRLEQMPGDLEKLFAQMLADVDPVHLRSLAFYLQAMKVATAVSDKHHAWYLNVAVLTAAIAATASSRLKPYPSFANDRRRTELQVIRHTAGLLDVTDNVFLYSTHASRNRDREQWEAADTKILMPDLINEGHTAKTRQTERVHHQQACAYPEILRYELRRVTWVHRSAFDYVFPTNSWQHERPVFAVDEYETLRRLAKGTIDLCTAAPSYRITEFEGSCTTLTDLRADAVMALCAESIDVGLANDAIQNMDKLHAFTKQLKPIETGDTGGPIQHFWKACIWYMKGYVKLRADNMTTELTMTANLLSMVSLSLIQGSDVEPWHLKVTQAVSDREMVALVAPNESLARRYDSSSRETVTSCIPRCEDLGLYWTLIAMASYILRAGHPRERGLTREMDIAIYSEVVHKLTKFIGEAQIQLFLPCPNWRHVPPHNTLSAARLAQRLASKRAYDHHIFTLQIPWNAFVATTTATETTAADTSWLRDTQASSSIEPLSAICGFWQPPGPDKWVFEEVHDRIILRLRDHTAKMLLHLVRRHVGELCLERGFDGVPCPDTRVCIYASLEEFLELRNSVIEDVWANEGSLTSTQQLMMLACVRVGMHDLWVQRIDEYDSTAVRAVYDSVARKHHATMDEYMSRLQYQHARKDEANAQGEEIALVRGLDFRGPASCVQAER